MSVMRARLTLLVHIAMNIYYVSIVKINFRYTYRYCRDARLLNASGSRVSMLLSYRYLQTITH